RESPEEQELIDDDPEDRIARDPAAIALRQRRGVPRSEKEIQDQRRAENAQVRERDRGERAHAELRDDVVQRKENCDGCQRGVDQRWPRAACPYDSIHTSL